MVLARYELYFYYICVSNGFRMEYHYAATFFSEHAIAYYYISLHCGMPFVLLRLLT
jgi:hypothetical protein